MVTATYLQARHVSSRGKTAELLPEACVQLLYTSCIHREAQHKIQVLKRWDYGLLIDCHHCYPFVTRNNYLRTTTSPCDSGSV